MMISYDHIDAGTASLTDRIKAANAAIHGYDKVDTIGDCALFKIIPGQPVTFGQAIRDVVIHISIQIGQKFKENRSGCNAISIIVSKDKHFFTATNSRQDALNGTVYIFHQERGSNMGKRRLEKSCRLILAADAAVYKYSCERRLTAQTFSQHRNLFRIR